MLVILVIMMIKVILLTLFATVAADPLIQNITICEHRERMLSCHLNHKIHIVSAMYGRLSTDICSNPSYGNINCHAGTSERKVKELCNGQMDCQLQSSNSVFGDPCPGTFKYLQVTYKCIVNTPGGITNGINNQQTTGYITLSSHGKYSSKKTGKPIVGMAVFTKYSHSACVLDQSFGFNDQKAWVDKGCQAKFKMTYGNGEYVNVGCFKDTRTRAISGGYRTYIHDPISNCFNEAKKKGFKYFAVQYNIQCFTSNDAGRTYRNYGESNGCRNGRGGTWSMNVYKVIGGGITNGNEKQLTTGYITLGSHGYKYASMKTGKSIVGMAVFTKYSHSACILDKSFGFDGQKAWVHKGCSANFKMTYGNGRYLTLSSINYTYASTTTVKHIVGMEVSTKYSHSVCVSEKSFGFTGRTAWVDKGCRAKFRMTYRGDYRDNDPHYPVHQLAVYWGQDTAGEKGLSAEKDLKFYCDNFSYDIIPISSLNIFFDSKNKDGLPGMSLSKHCSKTFDGYQDLLNCTDIGKEIKGCQKRGKKITLALGGSAGHYGFTSSKDANVFASTIWNLFLGGKSSVRPFGDAVLDGVDLDIEDSGTSLHYAEFVRSIRKLMSADARKKYIITAAPQCPYPNAVMGPKKVGTVLHEIPHEFDYLFVQFYNNYCFLGNGSEFYTSMYHWFDFAYQTKKTHGKGPSIFVGLIAGANETMHYTTPLEMKDFYAGVAYSEHFGGIMLRDASLDSNNVIAGRYYSTIISEYIHEYPEPEIIVCGILGGTFGTKGILLVVAALILLLTTGFVCYKKYRKSKIIVANSKTKSFSEYAIDGKSPIDTKPCMI